MTDADPQPLRAIRRFDLEGHYANLRTIWDCYALACHDNPAYRAIYWDHFNDNGYQRLTTAQRTLNNINLFDGQVRNGGLVQLFFNFAEEIEIILTAVNHLGYVDLTERFERHYAEAFIAPAKAGKLEELNQEFQEGVKSQLPWEQAVKGFRQAYEEFDFNAFDTWWYSETTEQAVVTACTGFMRSNEGELFAVFE